jgi:hypothetical protein
MEWLQWVLWLRSTEARVQLDVFVTMDFDIRICDGRQLHSRQEAGIYVRILARYKKRALVIMESERKIFSRGD